MNDNATDSKQIKCILEGGGKDIYRILDDFREILRGKSVAYLIVAAEKKPSFFNYILKTSEDLIQHLESLGAEEVTYVDSSNFEKAFSSQIIILSGGDTGYLIESLRKHEFKKNILSSPVQCIIGISAGAIAISGKGVGTKDNKETLFTGLGLIPETIVPHSNEDKKKRFPEAIHLEEYQWKEFVME